MSHHCSDPDPGSSSPVSNPDVQMLLSTEDLVNLIPYFDPDNVDGLHASEWLVKLDKLITLHDLDSRRAVIVAARCLKGVAKEWFESFQLEISGWEGFKEQFKKNFPEKMNSQKDASEAVQEKGTIDSSMIMIGRDLGEEDKERLLELINRFRSCFALDMKELGHTTVGSMRLRVKSDEVVRDKPHDVSKYQQDALEEVIQELIEHDIIEDSSSEYASPVVLVSKGSGGWKMCVDFRKINQLCQQEHFPLPPVEEELDKMAGKVVFSSLNVMTGYHQVEVEPESRHLTSFVVPQGQYQYKRMPYGLINSSSVFVKVMSKVLQPVLEAGVSFHVDDVVLGSVDVSQGFELLERTLVEIQKAGLTLDLEKSVFMEKEIQYLGHKLSREGISPIDSKMAIIRDFARPDGHGSLLKFLSLTSYFRRFIPAYLMVARP